MQKPGDNWFTFRISANLLWLQNFINSYEKHSFRLAIQTQKICPVNIYISFRKMELLYDSTEKGISSFHLPLLSCWFRASWRNSYFKDRMHSIFPIVSVVPIISPSENIVWFCQTFISNNISHVTQVFRIHVHKFKWIISKKAKRQKSPLGSNAANNPNCSNF